MRQLSLKGKSAGVMLALSFCLALASCTRKPPKSQIDTNTYAREIDQWHQERWKELNDESGWLTLIGLYWLKEGRNTVGIGPGNDIILPEEKMPLNLGTFILTNGVVKFETAPMASFFVDGQPISSVQLKTDADDKPTVITHGSMSFQIIKRGDKLALRAKDSQSPARLNFKGTEFYPADLKWRLDAQFEPYNPPKAMPITNVLGMESAESSPGAVKFVVNGKEYRLDAITGKGEPRLFMIISDVTSGKDTYTAGRYL